MTTPSPLSADGGGLIALIFVAFIALFIFGVIQQNKRARERREALAKFAADNGWVFRPELTRTLDDDFRDIGLFRRGSNRYGENLITGSHGGCGLLMFDYHYETESGSGKDRRTHHHHYGIVMLRPSFPLKPLVIRPEGMWDKLTAAFGWDDIDFESAEFSRRYHVSSPDRRWAFDVVTPRTMELLLAREKATLCMDLTQLMFSRPGRLAPDDMRDAIALCAAVLDGIPAFARESPRA
jgi:hypothetical protein